MWKYILFALIGWRCGHTPDDRADSKPLEPAETTPCHPYFGFDAVEHYSIAISEEDVFKLREKPRLTNLEKRQLEALLDYGPDSIGNDAHFRHLERLGFSKRNMNAAQMDTLRSIFCERAHEDFATTACVAVWRDILLFKQQGALTGTAKICFDCYRSSINGTNRNTAEFGGSGDFALLERLLAWP